MGQRLFFWLGSKRVESQHRVKFNLGFFVHLFFPPYYTFDPKPCSSFPLYLFFSPTSWSVFWSCSYETRNPFPAFDLLAFPWLLVNRTRIKWVLLGRSREEEQVLAGGKAKFIRVKLARPYLTPLNTQSPLCSPLPFPPQCLVKCKFWFSRVSQLISPSAWFLLTNRRGVRELVHIEVWMTLVTNLLAPCFPLSPRYFLGLTSFNLRIR